MTSKIQDQVAKVQQMKNLLGWKVT